MERRNKILSLREAGKSFEEIGRLFGVSRQRAHQIWKRVPQSDDERQMKRMRAILKRRLVRQQRLRERRNPDFTESRRSFAPRRKSRTSGIGAKGETDFEKRIRETGLKFEDIHERGDADFLVNGKFVEVKTSRLHSGKWNFTFVKNLGKFDVLACYGEWKGTWFWFIIPSEKVGNRKGIGVQPFTPTKGWMWLTQFSDNWGLLSPTCPPDP